MKQKQPEAPSALSTKPSLPFPTDAFLPPNPAPPERPTIPAPTCGTLPPIPLLFPRIR